MAEEVKKIGHKDPVLHSHIEDALPDDHPLAWESQLCMVCKVPLHASNNECMQTWIETGNGSYCLKHFAELPDSDALEAADGWGLAGYPKG